MPACACVCVYMDITHPHKSLTSQSTTKNPTKGGLRRNQSTKSIYPNRQVSTSPASEPAPRNENKAQSIVFASTADKRSWHRNKSEQVRTTRRKWWVAHSRTLLFCPLWPNPSTELSPGWVTGRCCECPGTGPVTSSTFGYGYNYCGVRLPLQGAGIAQWLERRTRD